jgi:membrane protein
MATIPTSTTPLFTKRRLILLRRRSQTLWRTTRDVTRFVIRRADQDKLFQVASSLTFTTVLSIVPLITTVFGVMTALPVFDRMRLALHSFLESRLMPEAISSSIFKYLDQFSSNASSLTIVSVLSFAVTSLMTMLTIDGALNAIWGVQRPRPLPQRLITYWAILSVGPILLGVSLTLASYLASVSAGFVTAPPPLVTAALDLVPIVLFTLAYGALYVFVPNRRVEWHDALIGAFVAALAFEAAKRGFAVYVTRFPTYTMVYGTLAAVPLLLVWIYYIWIITLGGALVAASLPIIYGHNWNRGQAPGDMYGDALRILRVLYRARQVDHPGHLPGMNGYAIRQAARLDYESADIVLERLEQDGLVIRTRQVVPEGPTRFKNDDLWLFAADASVVKLERVFHLFAFDPEHVSEMALDRDDPLAKFIRRQRLINGDESLENVFGTEAEATRKRLAAL